MNAITRTAQNPETARSLPPVNGPRQRRSTRVMRNARRGMASLLAMLFLLLFATLAVGFYTASAMSAQISANEKKLSLAQSAAEAGTQYLRYRLYKMVINPTTPDAQLMDAVA